VTDCPTTSCSPPDLSVVQVAILRGNDSLCDPYHLLLMTIAYGWTSSRDAQSTEVLQHVSKWLIQVEERGRTGLRDDGEARSPRFLWPLTTDGSFGCERSSDWSCLGCGSGYCEPTSLVHYRQPRQEAKFLSRQHDLYPCQRVAFKRRERSCLG